MEGNLWEGERSKCLVIKGYPAIQIGIPDENLIPGIALFLVQALFQSKYSLKRVTFPLFSELLLCPQFLKIIS